MPSDLSCTICFTLIHPAFHLNHKTTQVLIVLKLSFFLNQKEKFDHTYHSPTDILSEHHEYELFLLQNEIDAPNDNPDHYDIHTCSPINSMNYKWTTNLHDGYTLLHVMKSVGYITPSIHIPKHDLSSLAPPKGEIKSSFTSTLSTL